MKAAPPFEFDLDFYRGRYSDLAHLSPEETRDHFFRYGAEEGRQATALGSRPGLIERIQTLGSILEIGPFCNPVVRGENVRYLDMLDADDLQRRAAAIGIDTTACPARIDYVGSIADVDETFDAVVSSHSIEHQPDLIRHLQGVARILKPGGAYILFVPDKRYSFDHFIAESTIADVLQAYEEERQDHTFRSVIEHRALTTHNDPAAHWRGDHGLQYHSNQAERILNALDEWRQRDGYIDVHTWYFTPANFWFIMQDTHDCGLSPLSPAEIYPTLENTLEFFAVLRKA